MFNLRIFLKISFRIFRIICIVGGVNVFRLIIFIVNLLKGVFYLYFYFKYNGLNELKI